MDRVGFPDISLSDSSDKMNLPALQRDTVIIRLEAARTALAEAKSIQQTKAIADVAAAAEIYAKRQKLGEEAIDYAHAVKIEALRRLGELLKDTPKSKARFDGTGKEPSKNDALTLADMGLDKKTSSIAQKLATLPAKDFEEVREGHKSIGQAIAQVETHREKSRSRTKDGAPDETERLRAELEETKQGLADMTDTARELEDRLSAFECKEPDEQQREILKLRKQVAKLEAEIDRLTRSRNDYQRKCNELIRQVKAAQRKAA